jgi:hypothetical protein
MKMTFSSQATQLIGREEKIAIRSALWQKEIWQRDNTTTTYFFKIKILQLHKLFVVQF